MTKKDDILTRRVQKVLPDKKGLLALMKKKKIKLYQGFDPTYTNLHLGHTVGFRKLMDFANIGHDVTILFGTGTVLVGDPSLRSKGRKLITQKEIDENIKTWKKQVAPIVDFNKVKIKYNGDWLTKLKLKDIVKIASNISAVQLFKRDSFQKRLDRGDTVWYHETMYPLLQGYDSVKMDVDLEIGGTDQEFNMLIGRELQKKMNSREKYVLTTPMIPGTDGKTMSKTSANCIWLTDTADDMYVKTMRVIDSEIITYMTLLTDFPLEHIEKVKKGLIKGTVHPLESKKELAFDIVKQFHGEADAKKAQEKFERTFQKKTPSFEKVSANGKLLVNLVMSYSKSKSDAKRKIIQGGVDVNDATIKDPHYLLSKGDRIKIGKRIFIEIENING